ncbi:DoxX family protein [Streptomyces sp. SID3343]|uniref:DoxX family protein n=1 Tax=Streptomyces sp. SID3343 TaxID=2690260 RepID=UPI00136D7B56|nr:DoxX family protein [Streptomyces sp. SID3343]MYW01957.1 DoxX family membrane protein [Streptomyces sp. SID3343]
MSPVPHALIESARPHVLGLFRIVTGLLFICHGAASIFGVMGGTYGGGTIPSGEWPGWYAALIQLVGGGLVLLGLGTRPAALVSSGSMAYAYFTVHQENNLWPIQNGGEPSAMFCWSLLLIVVFGPGSFALDSLLPRRAASTATAAAPASTRKPVPVRTTR